MSVGVVLDKATFKEKRRRLGSLARLYMAAIDECPLISGLVKAGRLLAPLKIEQDYSYTAESLAGPGYFQIGDAACFIDPLLSTGVHLATHAGVLAAASLASTMRHEVEAAQARIFFKRRYRRAYLCLMIIVSGLYQLYDGKQTYFWKAQQLTERDYEGVAEIHEAFRHIISGLEDQRDSARTDGDRANDLGRDAVKYQLYDSVFRPFSVRPETAGNGLSLCVKPRLGLTSSRAALA